MSNAAYDLFTQPPLIEVRAPSVPTKSSEDAADAIEPFRRKSWRRILYTLASIPETACLSREEICERIGAKEGPACARLAELRVALWVEVVPDAIMAKSKRRVDGYRITAAGRGLFTSGENAA